MALSTRPTRIRYVILGLTTLVAVMLYLDRFCLGYVAPYIRENLGLSNRQIGFVLDAFFYTYAFGQIPCAWLSDRYGPRLLLGLYLAIWSSLTGLMGLAQGMTALLLFRLGCGLFESGAYPACAGIIRRWIPYERRGFASGVISLGGRIGGTLVPALTAYLMVSFVPTSTPSQFTADDVLDARGLAPIVLAPTTLPDDASLAEVLAPRLNAGLTSAAHAALAPVAAKVTADLRTLAVEKPSLDRHQLLRVLLEKHPVPLHEAQAEAVADALNRLLSTPELLDADEVQRFRHRLPSEALPVTTRETLTPDTLARSNRLILEAAFPQALRKIYGEAWRPALMIYGAAGLLLAVLFLGFVRDDPRRQPLVNLAEADLIQRAPPGSAAVLGTTRPGRLWRGILTSRSLWLSAFVQFGTNFGWIFLGNLFPLYLQQAYQVPELERGWMVTLPFMVSLPMVLIGGWWTDRMTRALGARWGRALPVALTRLVAAGAFVGCVFLNAPWPITLVLCLFSLVSDTGLPAIWAYCLDVGGRNVGVVLGWGNMFGNLGAAVSTSTLLYIQAQLQGKAGWDAVFLTCAAVFLVIGIASFGIDATKPIVADGAPEAG